MVVIDDRTRIGSSPVLAAVRAGPRRRDGRKLGIPPGCAAPPGRGRGPAAAPRALTAALSWVEEGKGRRSAYRGAPQEIMDQSGVEFYRNEHRAPSTTRCWSDRPQRS